MESNPPARRVQQSAWSDILTFADGVASGLNPFDDHRAGPVENGDPDVWNVGRAFGSGAGLIGDALLIFQGGQMVGGGAALTVAGQIEVGVPAMAVGSAAVGAGTIMAPRHAQQFGVSINQMSQSRTPAAGGPGSRGAAPQRVNLPGWRRVSIDMDHIASGHMQGGSRVPGSKKDLFPSWMTRTQVERAIRQAYRNGSRVATQVAGGQRRVIVRGDHDGLTIEIVVNVDTKVIETAYPYLR